MHDTLSLNDSWNIVSKDYTVKSFIGQGSFGQVVKAKHNGTKKWVAIKMISGFTKSPYHFKKVLREVEIMR